MICCVALYYIIDRVRYVLVLVLVRARILVLCVVIVGTMMDHDVVLCVVSLSYEYEYYSYSRLLVPYGPVRTSTGISQGSHCRLPIQSWRIRRTGWYQYWYGVRVRYGTRTVRHYDVDIRV